jgi:hypothetical protein
MMRRFTGLLVVCAVLSNCGGSGSSGGGESKPANSSDGDTEVSSDAGVSTTVITDILSAPVYADLVLDGSSRAETTITAVDGGEMTITSPSGDFFALRIPPGALPFDTMVSMTAASSDSIIGVDIQPDGLRLNGLAIIEMTPIAPVADSEPVWWDGTGEVNRPVAAIGDDGVVRFITDHFSGYGTAGAGAPLPAPTPIDEAMGRIRGAFSEAVDRESVEGVSDLSKIEAELKTLWESYVKPLLRSSKGSGCGAIRIFSETVRLWQMIQQFSFEKLNNSIYPEFYAQVDVLFREQKTCARQECSEGKLEAPFHMVTALRFGEIYDSTAAFKEQSDILAEVFLSGVTSPWVKCRAFDAFLSVDMNWDIRMLGPEFTNLHGISVGKGVLLPVSSGHSGDIGSYEMGSGMADFVARNGSMLLTGIAKGFGAVVGVDPGNQKVSCTESSSNHGLVNVSLSWESGTYPLATIKPLSSPITVTCASIAGTETSSLPNPAYLLLTLDPISQTQGDAFRHQFTKAELWPSATLSSVPLGFQWKERIDVQPLIAAEGDSDFSRRADTAVTFRLILGSTHSPRDQVPSTSGLIPPSQGLSPLAGS